MVCDRWKKYIDYVKSTICITINGEYITGSVPVGVSKGKMKYIEMKALAKDIDSERLTFLLAERMPYYWKHIGRDQ